jgi:hypothetical protein
MGEKNWGHRWRCFARNGNSVEEGAEVLSERGKEGTVKVPNVDEVGEYGSKLGTIEKWMICV